MRRGKIRSLLVALLVASGMWFAGGEARAETLDLTVGGAPCAVTFDSSTGFTSTSGNARYAYTLNTQTTISNIDLEIPSEIAISTSNVQVYFSTASAQPGLGALTGWSPASFELFAPGVGDSGTKLGTGDMRYWVLKINSSSKGFPLNFHVRIDISVSGLTLGYSPQVMLLKAGNGSVWASGSISAPTLASQPQPTVTLSATPNSLSPGECTTLAWSSTNATYVVLEPVGLVDPQGTRQECPADNTTYRITALGGSGLFATAEASVVVAPMPVPVIEVARQTIEKKDALGNITGNITFYFERGLPACSCTTGQGDLILDFPCNENPLPTNCSKAFLDPLLVCIPFPGKSQQDLVDSCASGSGNCTVIAATCGEPPAACFARCDTLEYLTLDTTIEVGPHSCTCTTSKVRLLNGTYKTITSCSGTPCP